jgi:hypothetical protein
LEEEGERTGDWGRNKPCNKVGGREGDTWESELLMESWDWSVSNSRTWGWISVEWIVSGRENHGQRIKEAVSVRGRKWRGGKIWSESRDRGRIRWILWKFDQNTVLRCQWGACATDKNLQLKEWKGWEKFDNLWIYWWIDMGQEEPTGRSEFGVVRWRAGCMPRAN